MKRPLDVAFFISTFGLLINQFYPYPMTLPPRLSEVYSYFQHGDLHLGYRRLLDAAIETNDFDIYEHTLNFSDWYDAYNTSSTPDLTVIAEKVQQLLEQIERCYQQIDITPGSIKLKAEGISKQYRKGHFNLSKLDVTLHTSHIIGLVGENGNGKTTLLRLLYGDLKADTGKIEYYFPDTKDSFYDIKSKIAFIPQRPSPWYGSLLSNLQYASTFAGLKGKKNMLWTDMVIARMGLRPYRTYTWNTLSSGYKMRFELARALMCRPEVLLLDEPLANLDMLAQQIVLEDLRFLSRSQSIPLSIMLSSQQLYEVEKVSDDVIFLQRGMARYQKNEMESQEKRDSLVLELETTESREVLKDILNNCRLQKLSFNGGVYILYFPEDVQLKEVLVTIGKSGLPVKYLRDISLSSRRVLDA